MIHFLRHTALRLWVSLPIAAGGCLWGLAQLRTPPGPQAAALIAAAALAAAFFAVGWAGGRLAARRVRRLVRAASLAERQGLYREAEEGLRGALDVLDTFLVSPAARRRNRPALAARLARFYLARTRIDEAAEDFLVGYLSRHPGDEEAVEQWVQHIEAQGGLCEEHQDLAARLGAAHPRNAGIQYSLARLYLMLERSDTPALQSYRSVCTSGRRLPPDFVAALARLLRSAGRADPWAEELFRGAGMPAPAAPAARAREETPVPAAPPPPAAEPDEDLGAFRIGIEAEDSEALEEEGAPSLMTRRRAVSVVSVAAAWIGRYAAAAARAAAGVLSAAAAGARGLNRSPAARRALGGGLLAALAAGALWVAVTVVGGWLQAPAEAPVAASSSTPPPVVEDPFTLQVAAYLKAEYALKFVEELKAKGLEAYSTETASGGKRWYQVRISRFPDPQSARDVGRDLKARGVIDDFYVTNYSK